MMMNPRRMLPMLVGLLVIVGAWLSSASCADEPAATAPAKRIYIAMDDHTDYMWSADEAYYRQAFLEMIDFYLDEIELSLEHQNPLVSGRVVGGKEYPVKSYSLLKVSRPEVFVWAVKPAEEGIGQGVIVRVWNVAHRPAEGTLEFARPLAHVKQTTHIENDLDELRLADGKVPVALSAQQMKTFRLTFEKQRR